MSIPHGNPHSRGRWRYFNNCVNWPSDDVDCTGGLRHLIDQCTELSREMFWQFVDNNDLRTLSRALGYRPDLPDGFKIQDDWHVQWMQSWWHGHRVFVLVHSAIEYVFTFDGADHRPGKETNQ